MRQLRPRVLLIDDDITLTRALSRNLREEYDVLSFNDPQAAFGYLLSDWEVSVVVADIQMPRWTGIDFHTHVLDEIPEMADRFIYITGICKDVPFFVQQSRKLLKPFRLEAITALIDEIDAVPKNLYVPSERAYQPLRRIV